MTSPRYDFHGLTRLGGFRILIVTGACRSGKTTLGNLLGSARSVEYIDEPWLPMMLPILERLQLLDTDTAISMMRASVEELFSDRILLRNANFRRSDQSCVLDVKECDEINARLNEIHSREEVVEYVREHDTLLVLGLAETRTCTKFFRLCFPDCGVVHVVRHGAAVATDVSSKEWLSDHQLLTPANNVLYQAGVQHRGRGPFYLPWWVAREDCTAFLDGSVFSRGLYYWRRMVGDEEGGMPDRTEATMHIVRYEDLRRQPTASLQPLIDAYGLRLTGKTETLLAELSKRPDISRSEVPRKISKGERSQTADLLQEYGYPIPEVWQ